MAFLKKIESYPDVVNSFKEVLFYNKQIEKPTIKRLKNFGLLSELLFYEELKLIKTNHASRGYEMSYIVELVEKKDQIEQLEARKSSIIDLFSDLLNETKVFNNQITPKVILKICKNTEIEFAPVLFQFNNKNSDKS